VKLREHISRRHLAELALNRALTHVPVNELRIRYLRMLGASLGPNIYLFGGSEFIRPDLLSIERNCHIGRSCQIDARGGISIGANVVIASHTLLITADHDVQSPDFAGRVAPIAIDDRAWIASRAVVLKGVRIGEGAVVAAGTVVHRDVAPWSIVSGAPAQVIGERSRHQTYEIDQGPEFY
jgi:putative colanic acid biosynthesis acetyltransferase WcaF